MISATAVIPQEKLYSRYSEVMVWKYANTVYTHATRNTQEPISTITVGTIVFPIPLEAAMVQSMKALMT